jgi:DNA-binding LacI/PurR family transcriptional regulator
MLSQGAEPISFVDVDNVGGAKLAVNHLLVDGRRVIGTVAGPQPVEEMRREMARLLLDLMRGDAARRSAIFDTHLVRRGSA